MKYVLQLSAKKVVLAMLAIGLTVPQTEAKIRLPWQKKKAQARTEATTKTTDNSTQSKPDKPIDKKGPKPFAEVIKSNATAVKGLFTAYKSGDSYFFEIPDSLLGRDMLVVSRITKAASDMRVASKMVGYAGDMIGERVIRFERRDNKLYLRTVSYSERSQDSTGMLMAVSRSNMLPIAASFDIKAYRNGKTNPIIDVTDFLSGDSPLLFFSSSYKKTLELGGLAADKSYIDTVRAFPMNVEVSTVKTYSLSSPSASAKSSAGTATYQLNTSIVLLPDTPMKPRIKDERVGYFSLNYTDFDLNPQGVEKVSLIARWRLEPKDEDIEKYMRGELVEPKKPIVYYIDPATPKKWIPYLKAGVNDWQTAFEHAGFKNAIYALEVSPKDTLWSLDDARHSAIVYKPSTISNASGPHISDPRTGEILESHINWYHNVMELLRNWYFVQAATVDPDARQLQFSDELMGQLIRFVSSHEVGHTLGLRHNFGSSNTVPVENLRNKKWVEANGHTPSIMDYARFNYVAQPEDGISKVGIFPRIGMYDKWAIEWGYRWFPQFDSAQEEVPTLDSMVVARLRADKRYTFGSEVSPTDPRNQSEDLGDNAMIASEYGIKNLKRILPNLQKWTYKKGGNFSETRQLYEQIVGQYARYMGHVAKNIGGIYKTPRKADENATVAEYVPASTQREAMQFLTRQLFDTPKWLFDSELQTKVGVDPVAVVGKVQQNILGRLQGGEVINNLSRFQYDKGALAYSPLAFYADLQSAVWGNLASSRSIDMNRRQLQRAYISNLAKMILSDEKKTSTALSGDAPAVARGQLNALRTRIRSALALASGMNRYHLEDCLAQIQKALDDKK